MSLNTELTRYKLKPNKENTVNEWMDMLRNNLPATLATLEGEKMYVESIFSDFEESYIYWFSVQGEGGIEVNNSEHAIDKKHLEYFKECIEEVGSPERKKNFKLELSMINPKLKTHIEELESK